MAYTKLKNSPMTKNYREFSLEKCALRFIRESCEELRFKEVDELSEKSIASNKIPHNMEKDIERLCLEKAIERFLNSGRKEDAFDVYFCYLEMFVGDYKKTRKMIELLSEYENNGSGILMKHRDHYSHSVYVFCLGLAIYESNKKYREAYKKSYKLEDERKAAHHYLKYWGMTSLFHDIGYPFELPFEQVCAYFEVDNKKRKEGAFGNSTNVKRSEIPYLVYHNLKPLIEIDEGVQKELKELEGLSDNENFSTTNELFAYILANKFEKKYGHLDEYASKKEELQAYLEAKPEVPDKFNYFMDHAYFSANLLFKKLFKELKVLNDIVTLDALTGILLHNSLYKFCVANPKKDLENLKMHLSYKRQGNIPLTADVHPLAYMLMLCDELQCWDRTAYGRDSKTQLHPMGCSFVFSNDKIEVTYLYDEVERLKIDHFKDSYIQSLQGKTDTPELKAYSEMYIKDGEKSDFQKDIERIVDLKSIEAKFDVKVGITKNVHRGNGSYLSDSKFINLYRFAVVLNGRWDSSDWRRAKDDGVEDVYLNNFEELKALTEKFDKLPLEYKLSNINQAKAFAKHLNEIDCFYTDKPVDFDLVENFTEEELEKIGVSEHQRWLQEHYDMGWTYGTPEKSEREILRQHKDMIPDFDGKFEVSVELARANYERLDKSEQNKDTEPMECMLAMLRMFDGLRIYRLK